MADRARRTTSQAGVVAASSSQLAGVAAAVVLVLGILGTVYSTVIDPLSNRRFALAAADIVLTIALTGAAWAIVALRGPQKVQAAPVHRITLITSAVLVVIAGVLLAFSIPDETKADGLDEVALTTGVPPTTVDLEAEVAALRPGQQLSTYTAVLGPALITNQYGALSEHVFRRDFMVAQALTDSQGNVLVLTVTTLDAARFSPTLTSTGCGSPIELGRTRFGEIDTTPTAVYGYASLRPFGYAEFDGGFGACSFVTDIYAYGMASLVDLTPSHDDFYTAMSAGGYFFVASGNSSLWNPQDPSVFTSNGTRVVELDDLWASADFRENRARLPINTVGMTVSDANLFGILAPVFDDSDLDIGISYSDAVALDVLGYR